MVVERLRFANRGTKSRSCVNDGRLRNVEVCRVATMRTAMGRVRNRYLHISSRRTESIQQSGIGL